jgi:hypothetical protein
MPVHEKNALRYLTFSALENFPGLVHAVFTRHGGDSQSPWNSLNLGGSVGDEPANVASNKRKALQIFGYTPQDVFEVWQVHSAAVVTTQKPRQPDEALHQADIILTDQPGVVLLMRFADCVPILLYDPRQRVVGLAHAGWQGTVKGAARAAVQALQARYQSHPADVVAVIGPSIGPDHYEIGADVRAQVQQAFGQAASQVLHAHNGRVHFDLWTANVLQLQQSGVKIIQSAQICTACHTEDWYSHRREAGRTGRFGALIGIQ